MTEAREGKGEELTIQEKLIVAAPAYIPAVLTGLGTIACVIGANVLNKKHQESLASAYILLNQSYQEYRNKVIEMYGEDADREVNEAIFEDRDENDQKIELFYERSSGLYFESTLFKVQQAEYFLNRELIMKDYAYLNEWYELLELPTVDNGWDIGWSTGLCLDCYWQPWIDFSHSIKTNEEGREYHVIDFWEEPIENFADYC